MLTSSPAATWRTTTATASPAAVGSTASSMARVRPSAAAFHGVAAPRSAPAAGDAEAASPAEGGRNSAPTNSKRRFEPSGSSFLYIVSTPPTGFTSRPEVRTASLPRCLAAAARTSDICAARATVTWTSSPEDLCRSRTSTSALAGVLLASSRCSAMANRSNRPPSPPVVTPPRPGTSGEGGNRGEPRPKAEWVDFQTSSISASPAQ
mmetsp:Transcript_24006/g.67387  ORF Transcript_24006/g.67387 Transcript_24006/m.67387 type:complete len:207 (-) Transcript_24006:320-940(-)